MGRFFKRLVTNFAKEFKNILFALIIAIVVWFAISMQIFPDVVAHIGDIPVNATPTEFMNDNNLSIAEGYDDTVTAKISGKRYAIGSLTNENFTAELDLSDVKDVGEHIVGVKVKPVGNVECTVDDSQITVKIKVEKIVTKTFSIADGSMIVTADDIHPVDNMKIDSITAEPATITLTGDQAELDAVKKIEIRSVYAGTANQSVNSKGQIVMIGANGAEINNPDITFDNESFSVNVSLFKQKTLPLTVQFTNVPANFDISSLKYSIYPETLTISSPDDSVDSQEKFEVGTIDLSELTTKYLQKLTLPITLPEGFKNVSGNTSAMITFENADDYTFLSFAVQKENIRIVNAPADFDIDILTNEINVTVTGPLAEISALSSMDIYATVDLMGMTLSEGLKDVTAQFTLRGGKVQSWVTGQYKVSLQITEAAEDDAQQAFQQY